MNLRHFDPITTLVLKDRVDRKDAENARLREALHQCRDYFDDRADAATEDDRWVGNDEMRLLGVVQTALGEK